MENENNKILDKVLEYLETIDGEVSYKEIAEAIDKPEELIQNAVKEFVSIKQKELEKNPLVALNGPDPDMEILIYKIKDLAKARFYIEGLKNFQKIGQTPGKIKNKLTGFFNRGGK